MGLTYLGFSMVFLLKLPPSWCISKLLIKLGKTLREENNKRMPPRLKNFLNKSNGMYYIFQSNLFNNKWIIDIRVSWHMTGNLQFFDKPPNDKLNHFVIIQMAKILKFRVFMTLLFLKTLYLKFFYTYLNSMLI